MPIVKPPQLPRFGEVVGNQGVIGPNEIEPNAGKKDSGWVPAEEPPAGYFNWLFRTIYDWVQYIAQAFFTADVGSGNPGIRGTGDGAGAGVSGIGSSAGSAGVSGTGTVNNPGLSGTGQGTGAGVSGIGGATNAPGFSGAGTGTGAGANLTGGATGPGVLATAGGGGAPARGAIALAVQAAPSAPANGDLWTTISGVFARIAGATIQLAAFLGGITVFHAGGTSGTVGLAGIALGSAAYATTGTYGSGLAGAASGAITIANAGTYRVTAQIGIAFSSITTYVIGVYKNGGIQTSLYESIANPNATLNAYSVVISGLLNFAAGDVVQLFLSAGGAGMNYGPTQQISLTVERVA